MHPGSLLPSSHSCRSLPSGSLRSTVDAGASAAEAENVCGGADSGAGRALRGRGKGRGGGPRGSGRGPGRGPRRGPEANAAQTRPARGPRGATRRGTLLIGPPRRPRPGLCLRAPAPPWGVLASRRTRAASKAHLPRSGRAPGTTPHRVPRRTPRAPAPRPPGPVVLLRGVQLQVLKRVGVTGPVLSRPAAAPARPVRRRGPDAVAVDLVHSGAGGPVGLRDLGPLPWGLGRRPIPGGARSLRRLPPRREVSNVS